MAATVEIDVNDIRVISSTEDNRSLTKNVEGDARENEDDKDTGPKKWYQKLYIMGPVIFLLSFAILLMIILSMTYSEPYSNPYIFKHAGVASDHETCSKIGRDILKEGGSAVDGAIATMLCIGVIFPESAGIGGGHFMTVYDKFSNKAVVINARETAPGNATETMYDDNDDSSASTTGGLAIAVPGEISGYWKAHQMYGYVDWEKLFLPSIELAEDGFEVTEHLRDALANYESTIVNDETWCSIYCDDSGTSVKGFGETVKNPLLASTYRSLSQASDAESLFYSGDLAKMISEDIIAAGGIVSQDDLSTYEVQVEDPVTMAFGDYTLVGPGPPSSTVIYDLIVGIVNNFNFNSRSMAPTYQADTLHKIIESMKFGFAARSALGDPNYVENMEKVVANLTDLETAYKLYALINDTSAQITDYYGAEWYTGDDAGTTHVSVIAEDGSAASITSTVNLWFGSKVISSQTGIVFNDEMDDFSSPGQANYFGLEPSIPNYISAGKRPLSSMSPVIVLDKYGDVKLVVGGAGGPRIITGALMVTLNALMFDMDLDEAVDMERIHHQLLPNYVSYEEGLSESVIEALKYSYNQTMVERTSPISIVNTIMSVDEGLYVYSDMRRNYLYPGVSGY